MISIGLGHNLSIQDFLAVANARSPVTLPPATAELLTKRRKQIVDYVSTHNEPAYGFNRGFGHNAVQAVPPSKLAELQLNIIRSHASGVGPASPVEVVRGAMLLRAHSLAQGYSGVRAEVVSQLVNCLNAGVVPEVPQFGSVGASGDLAPLSHIALGLIGEGRAYYQGKLMLAKDALAAAQIRPLSLEMKEGLALNNGVQFSTAYAILCLNECRTLLRTAVLNSALAVQVLLGRDAAFAADLHALRPHPGARAIADLIWGLVQDAPVRTLRKQVEGMQDPYSLRCSAQILGSCYDLIEEAAATFTIEMNSVTDNPLILPASDAGGAHTRIISGGHFHGMPVAVKIYNLVQALAIMARLSNMRCARFVDERRNSGLGNDLTWPTLSPEEHSTSSGMMVAEYASAALTNYIWGASFPSHLLSISTDAGQEDHVSMSAGLAVRVAETIPRVCEAMAVELAFCAQAAAIRKVSARDQAAFNPRCEKVLARVSEVFPAVIKDRSLSGELKTLSEVVRSGELLALAGIE